MIQLGRNAALALTLAALLGGCAYDYTQQADNVAFSHGDAVRTNMALQTIDPSKKSMNDTTGLGQDGNMPIVDVVVKYPIPGEE
jgi:hypothetical protein